MKTNLFKISIIFIAFSFGIISSTSATQSDITTVLKRIEKSMAEVKTLQASFVQKKNLSIFQQELVILGQIFMEKPDSFAWRVTKPLPYVLVIKNNEIQQWDEASGAVQRISLSKNQAFKTALRQMQDWFKGSYSSLTKDYEINLLNEFPLKLKFKPKEMSMPAQYIDQVIVTFQDDEKYIEQIDISEKGGDLTEMKFRETMLNGPIPKSAWKVSP